MDIIQKIALTAAILFFLLTQIFSYYVIVNSEQVQIALLKEAEQNNIDKAYTKFSSEYTEWNGTVMVNEHMLIYFFRKYMPANSALYQGERELCNDSVYEYQISQFYSENYRQKNCEEQRIDDKHILIFYYNAEINTQEYWIFHTLDITSVYKKSRQLMAYEIMVSLCLSFFMTIVLVILIQKITRTLKATNEAQRQLIGSMSHELKTPLTAIQGYSEMLLQVKLTEEQEQKALRYIYTESSRMSRLSEKMMELTKLYQSECRLSLQQVELEELFERVERSIHHSLQEKQLILLREGDYVSRSFLMDEDLMTSFLINLINNSILASKKNGNIYLGADDKSIWVRDEGCGIPKEELHKVAQAFYRVDKSRSGKNGNMGLGLALCEQIAKAHNAKMRIESELGVGTKVSIVWS